MEPWVGDYIGIPYRRGASGHDGADCWGLVCLVLRERFGVTLPMFDPECGDHARLAAFFSEHRPLVAADSVPEGDERAGDIALLTVFCQPIHVGILVGDGLMLHTLGAHDSALEAFRGPRWAKRLEGVYRVQ